MSLGAYISYSSSKQPTLKHTVLIYTNLSSNIAPHPLRIQTHTHIYNMIKTKIKICTRGLYKSYLRNQSDRLVEYGLFLFPNVIITREDDLDGIKRVVGRRNS